MLEQLIRKVLDDANAAHRAHLLTESYSAHMALAEFYDAAREKVDAIVESGIGLDLPLPEADEETPLALLEAAYVELVEKRDETCQGASVMENLYDELLHVYTSAIFKLKRFS